MIWIVLDNTLVFYTLLILFSLVVGSFLNVVIYRLPHMIQTTFKTECALFFEKDVKIFSEQTVNLFLPRSFCPHCKKTISAIHNIPVLSYLFCRGRCYHCHDSISYQYPLVEILSAFLACLAFIVFGFTKTACFIMLFSWCLIPLIIIDLKHQILPDALTLGLLWLGLLTNLHTTFVTLQDAVLGAMLGWIALWSVIQLYWFFTGKIGMGHGDFKLLAAFGAWFGWQSLAPILFMASFLGAIIGLLYLKYTQQSKETPIPFGPFLCLAGFSYLYGAETYLTALWRLF